MEIIGQSFAAQSVVPGPPASASPEPKAAF